VVVEDEEALLQAAIKVAIVSELVMDEEEGRDLLTQDGKILVDQCINMAMANAVAGTRINSSTVEECEAE
jgi:hypothetical protein